MYLHYVLEMPKRRGGRDRIGPGAAADRVGQLLRSSANVRVMDDHSVDAGRWW
jgi:hypothetical protein